MLKKRKKIFVLILIFVEIITAIMVGIISTDIYHIKHCNIENCTKCISIGNAINFIKNLINAVKNIIILNNFIAIIALIRSISISEKQNTLIEKKVQFNE